jgi:two-component system response regulator WspF
MRVAVVNASEQQTGLLVSLLRSAGHEIAWCASGESQALLYGGSDRPDLVLVDLATLSLASVHGTAVLIERLACAVIVVAPSGEGAAAGVFQAMANGAMDVIPAPTIDSRSEVRESEEILYKIRLAAQLLDSNEITNRSIPAKNSAGDSPVLIAMGASAGGPRALVSNEIANRSIPAKNSAGNSPVLIAIGASAGGPRALVTVLSGLSRPVSAAVVIIQHIDSLFSENLAEWLARESSLPVSLAKEGDKPREGHIVIAGTNDHMVLTAGQRFHYQAEPLDYPYRPSINQFFESARQYWPRPGIAVLLTGMGKDGASGLLTLRETGWHTIAQDEQSSAIYGMPRAAHDVGAAVETLPIGQIGASISRRVAKLRAATGSTQRVEQ